MKRTLIILAMSLMLVSLNYGQYVKIGKTGTNAKLDVFGQIKIVDTTLGANKVLTSDVNGLARWETLNAWSLTGNAGTSETNNFIGTTDNKGFAIRTNDTSRIFINNTGYVGIGTTNLTEKFQVEGNSIFNGDVNISGKLHTSNIDLPDTISTRKIVVSRISSPDSLIYIGDSTLVFTNHGIYNHGTGLYKGLGLGLGAASLGLYSVSLGHTVRAEGLSTVAIGTRVGTLGGKTNNIVIGEGTSGGLLINDISSSLMVGFNSDIPTLIVTHADGVGTTGNVGIGTTNPTSILHTVASGIKAEDYTGNLFSNFATSTTSSSQITKVGVEIISTGAWNSIKDNINIGLYVSSVTGGGINYDAIFNGGYNVGIGTNSPIAKLHIKENSNNFAVRIENINEQGKGLLIKAGNGSSASGSYSLIDIVDNSGYSIFRVDGYTNKTFMRGFESTINAFPDYVFENGYDLMPLMEKKKYWEENKHLPGFSSASEIAKKVDIPELIGKQMKEIEELYLYLTEIKKENEMLKQRIELLEQSK